MRFPDSNPADIHPGRPISGPEALLRTIESSYAFASIGRCDIGDRGLVRSRPFSNVVGAPWATGEHTRPKYRCLQHKRQSKPHEFIGIGPTDATKTYNFIWFGDTHGSKPYKLMGFRWAYPPVRPGSGGRFAIGFAQHDGPTGRRAA